MKLTEEEKDYLQEAVESKKSKDEYVLKQKTGKTKEYYIKNMYIAEKLEKKLEEEKTDENN